MNCKDIYVPLHRYVDGESPPEEGRDVEKHINECPKCKSTLEMLRAEQELIGHHLQSSEAPQDVTRKFEQVSDRIEHSRQAPEHPKASEHGSYTSGGGVPSPMLRRLYPLSAAAALLITIAGVMLAVRESSPVATIAEIGGDIALLRANGNSWQDISGRKNVPIHANDTVKTHDQYAATMRYSRNCAMELDVDTQLTFLAPSDGRQFNWRIERGRLRCEITGTTRSPSGGQSFEMQTPAGQLFGPPAGFHIWVRPLSDERSTTGSARQRGFVPSGQTSPRPGQQTAGDNSSRERFALLRSASAAKPRGPLAPQVDWAVEVTVLRGTVTMANPLGERRVPEGTTAVMTGSKGPTVPRSADLAAVLRWRTPSSPERAGIEPIINPVPDGSDQPSPRTDGNTDQPVPIEDSPERLLPDTPGEQPTPLQPPTDVKADVGLDSITITWQPGPTGDRTLHYDVYRRDDLPVAAMDNEGEGPFVKVNAGPVEALSFTDNTVSHAATYCYAVVAVGRGEQVVETAKGAEHLIDSFLSESVKVRSPDFTITYTGGNEELAAIMVRKFYRGYWRPTMFYVKPGAVIGRRRLVRLPDGLGGIEQLDYTTGYRLVEIKDAGEDEPGTMSIIIDDDHGHRYELPQRPAH